MELYVDNHSQTVRSEELGLEATFSKLFRANGPFEHQFNELQGALTRSWSSDSPSLQAWILTRDSGYITSSRPTTDEKKLEMAFSAFERWLPEVCKELKASRLFFASFEPGETSDAVYFAGLDASGEVCAMRAAIICYPGGFEQLGDWSPAEHGELATGWIMDCLRSGPFSALKAKFFQRLSALVRSGK
jgi:hypothetical protein